jgi:hypothetical protein
MALFMYFALWVSCTGSSALGLTLFLTACSGSHTEGHRQARVNPNIAPGTVLVDVLEGGQPQHYWQYQVQPASGTVEAVREETFEDYKHINMPRDFSRPAGALPGCSQSPRSDSPSGEYVAYCRSGSSPDFYIADKTGRDLHHWRGKGIRGFAWSPNSNSIAILAISGSVGMRPLELLSFLSGHPVSHGTVFLEIMDARTGRVTEYLVRRDVVSSFTKNLEPE